MSQGIQEGHIIEFTGNQGNADVVAKSRFFGRRGTYDLARHAGWLATQGRTLIDLLVGRLTHLAIGSYTPHRQMAVSLHLPSSHWSSTAPQGRAR